MLTYLACQAAMIVGYRYRHTAEAGLLRARLPAAAVAAAVWLVLACLVMPATWRTLRSSARRAAAELGPARLIALILLLLLGWVRLPGCDPDWFKKGLAFMALLLLGNISGLILLVVLVRYVSCIPSVPAAARRVHDRIMHLATWKLLALASCFCFIAAAALCQLVVRPIPHIPDEAAYLYQARVFASGRLVNDLAPAGLADLFRSEYVWDRPYGHSVFPPGWPAVLALGAAVGLPWLVNPLLAAACVPFLYLLVREVWSHAQAVYAVLLLCVCPFFLLMSATLMSHTLSLLAALVAVSGLLLGRRSWRWSCLGGLGLAMLFVTRPLEGTLAGAMLGLAFLYRLLGKPGARRLTLMFAVALAGPAAWLGFNKAVVGGWLDAPVNRYFRQVKGVSNQLGFGPDRGTTLFHSLGPGHSPLEAAFNLQYNLHSGNERFWGWPGGAAVLIAFGLLGRSPPRVPKWALAAAIALIGAYGLYWYHGECFGPRFYFVLLPVMLMLTLAGMNAVAGILKAPAAVIAIAAVPFTFLVHVPAHGMTLYHNTRGVSEELRARVRRPPATPAIVLLRNTRSDQWFSSTVPLNDLALADELLYARDRNRRADLDRIRRAFPDRDIYRYRDGQWKLIEQP